jgi:hypothetical protein
MEKANPVFDGSKVEKRGLRKIRGGALAYRDFSAHVGFLSPGSS